MQLPLGDEKNFYGLIDLVNLRGLRGRMRTG